MNQENNKTIIIGLGETGYSCVRYLKKLNIPLTVLDTRENPPKLALLKEHYSEVPFYGGKFPAHILAQARTIILSPGMAKNDPDIINSIAKDTVIIGDIELFAQAVQKPVVAITGSNGKSTVTTLVGEMAKAAGIKTGVGGNLGTPALDLLSDNPDLYVLELSSFQLETTYSLAPRVATVLNISPDHMDRYASFAEYCDAKLRIYTNCQTALINRDETFKIQNTEIKKRFSFGLDLPKSGDFGLMTFQDKTWLAKGDEPLLPVEKLKMFGRHNIANALAALAIGSAIPLPMQKMLTVLETFKGLPHRSEWVRELNGVQWINDSKGTNVGATMAALQGLGNEIRGKWILIAGGIGKNADFSILNDTIGQHCRAVILMGEAKEELENQFGKIVPCRKVNDMSEAVRQAFEIAKPGDGVLLSPACASFDMFKNFEARGNIFKQSVLRL